ncbi:hypothetical protein [Stenotrophomonas nematodicola]|uniref:hypothetical protein n=1 Tax=Stenotrophomonas nematodicola TaxID=2656746 RepID=UPI003D9A7B9E
MSAGLTVVGAGAVLRDRELENEVAGIWDDVLRHIEDVLAGAEHGYENILSLANPSIEEIVKSISKIDDLLNQILDGTVGGKSLDIEVELKLNDCQQCVHLIRRVHIALKHDNQDEYDDVIRKLTNHQ